MVLNSASVPPASIRIDGFLSTFLYHCVSDPYTGNRYSCSSSNTNQTGTEMVRPDFLPVTLMLISRALERRSLNESFRVDLLVIQILLYFQARYCSSFHPVDNLAVLLFLNGKTKHTFLNLKAVA